MYRLRRQFMIDPAVTFLNHGSFGAVPRQVFRVYQSWQRELENQPVEFLGRRATALMAEARLALGNYLGTRSDNLVYTTNVTVAINIVARSLVLGPGDEVLATDHEYGAMDRTWRFLAKECGFTYTIQPIPVPLTTPEAFLNSFWKGVTPRTRVIFMSHITSPTALVLPVEQVVKRAHAQGIITVIDGAHVPGQIPLRLDELGADFYGGNLHKWLCAPKGAGFLYASAQRQLSLKPLVVSWGYESETPGTSQFVDEHEWWGTRDLAAFLSVPAAIGFQEQHDWDKIRTACHELVMEGVRKIGTLTGLPPLSDSTHFVQMAAVPLPDTEDVDLLKVRLYEKYHIEVPVFQWKDRKLIRISVQGYNTNLDVNKLVSALRNLI